MPDIKVWWIPQIPMEPFEVTGLPDLDTAVLLCNTLADYDLFQYNHRVKPDYANTGGVMIRDEDGEWFDFDYEDADELAYAKGLEDIT